MKTFYLSLLFIFNLSVAFTQCLPATNNLITQYNSNNGQRGCMFNITAINDITVTCLDANLYAGTTANYEIYYKVGSYVGSENNAGAWTLAGGATGITSAGNNLPTPLPIPLNLAILAGQTYGIYVTNDFGAGTSYTDSPTAGNMGTDANISVFGGVGKSYPFGLTFSFRWFNGTINYVLGATALPVSLTSVSANVFENSKVMLNWTTNSETNNDFYNIEHSDNGVDWEFLAKIDGAGNSTEVNSYNYLHQKPKQSINYYRITQVDFDGKSTIIATKSVKLTQSSVHNIKVYPNPSSDMIHLNISKDENDGVEIYDLTGKLVSTIVQQEFQNGQLAINVSKLNNGLYIIRGTTFYSKFFKN